MEPLTRARGHPSYSTGLTREGLGVLLLTLLSCGLMGRYGLWINQNWPGRGTWLLVASALLGLAVAAYFWSHMRRSLQITPEALVFRRGGTTHIIPWEAVRDFQPHPSRRKLFRESLLIHGEQHLVVDSFSFPRYDEMVERLEGTVRSRRRRRGAPPDLS